MKKTVIFVLPNPFADWEFGYVAAGLAGFDTGNGDHEVKTLSLEPEVRSIGGLTVKTDYNPENIPENIGGLILIGGIWREEKYDVIAPLVEKAFAKKIPVGAICDAATYLAYKGFLNDADHTGNDAEDMAEYAKENYKSRERFRNERSVTDTNKRLVTADGTSPLEFARDYMLLTGDFEEKDIETWYDMNRFGYDEACKKHEGHE